MVRLEGSMSLAHVFDLVDYKRSEADFVFQFLGVEGYEPLIIIDDNLIPSISSEEYVTIPSWMFPSVSNFQAESFIKAHQDQYPFFVDFAAKWSSHFKGLDNLYRMINSQEDLQIFEDMYRFISQEADIFIYGNLKTKTGGNFDSIKFEKSFRAYFDTKYKGVDKNAANEIYNVIFKPGLTTKSAYRVSQDVKNQAEFLLLDIIMRNLVLIQADPDLGGPHFSEVAGRVENVMNDVQLLISLRKFMLSGTGRIAFFDKFREGFFDSVKSDLSFSRLLTSLKARILEAEDAMEDVPDILIDILTTSNFEAIINGMNYGRVSNQPGSSLGLNQYIDRMSSRKSVEFELFNSDTSDIHNNLMASDRSYIDSIGGFLTDDGFFAREDKNTKEDKITASQKKEVANDLSRDAFMLVLIELTKIQSRVGNIQLRDLRKLSLTAAGPSLDPATDLFEILNHMGWVMDQRKGPFGESSGEKTQFEQFRAAGPKSDIKFPVLYTLLYTCADKLNNRISGKSQTAALIELNNYFNSGEFRTEIENLAMLIFTQEHFAELHDGFFESVEQYFDKNLNNFLLPTADGNGFEVSFGESFNLLFKKLDSNGAVKLKVKDLPSDIKIYENGNWIKFSDSLKLKYPTLSASQIQDMELDTAYIIVHGLEGTSVINGLMRVDSVKNQLPAGIKEGFRDSTASKVYHNIFVSDAYGNYLYSRINLKQFTVKSNGWQLLFTNTRGESQKNLYLCFGLTSGSQYLSFLFDTTVELNAKNPFQEYFKGIVEGRTVGSKVVMGYEYIELKDTYMTPETVDLLDLKSNLVSSVIYQFMKDYDLTISRRRSRYLVGVTQVFLTDAFLNLYEHETYYYSINRFKEIFNILGLNNEHFAKIAPVALSQLQSQDPHLNEEYSPKQFYYTFLEALWSNINELYANGFITEETKDDFLELGQFSDEFINDLYDDTVADQKDIQLIDSLDMLLDDIFGYTGFSLLKSGLISINLDESGYHIICFSPDTVLFAEIFQRTHIRSESMRISRQSLVSLSKYYFEQSAKKFNFFEELFLKGYKQTFIKDDYFHTFHTKPQGIENRLGDLAYFNNFKESNYKRYTELFAKDTSSHLIVQGRSLIIQKISEMLRAQVTPFLFTNYYSSQIYSINKGQGVSLSEATKIVQDLLVNNLLINYLDSLYVGSETHDYPKIISNMITGGISQTYITHRTNQYETDFFKNFRLIFDLGLFTTEELTKIIPTLRFSYDVLQSKSKPAWALSIDSIISELKEPMLKTYDFLLDVFNNYPAGDFFTVTFHRPTSTGISGQSSLNLQMGSKYNDINGEISGTTFTIDRRDSQSVIDGITSIIYYMYKFNTIAIIKEGNVNNPYSSTVICLNQLGVLPTNAL